jgi:hypothetical protein
LNKCVFLREIVEVVIVREAEKSVCRIEAWVMCIRGPWEWIRFCSRGCVNTTNTFVLLPVVLLAFAGAVGGGFALGTAFEGVWEFGLELEVG